MGTLVPHDLGESDQGAWGQGSPDATVRVELSKVLL